MRNLDHLAAFVAVVEAGGFNAAARRLGLTPNAVHKAVVNMEAELGVQLFTGTRRVTHLTEAGAVYLDGCRRVLAAVEDVAGTLAGYRDGPSGLLRVSMPPTLGRLHFVPALGDFLARFPDIRVEALLTDRIADAAEEGVDAVFRVAPPADSRMVFHALAVPVYRISASPAYLARRGTPRAPADLKAGGHECISVLSPDTGKLSPWRFLGADGRVEGREMRGRLVVTDSDAEFAAAVAGLGLAQLPDYVAAGAIASGELVEVLPEHRHDGPPISIGHLQGRHLLPKVRVLVDYFVEWFASGVTRNAA